ncbi:RlpA-like double-psi beta-barrel-protein domain-containing protein-containing protein [Xylariaceae sp. FL0662B]|nr:RlpA-like double-psi beta-barrel-protein domain-containing protein-containing protein [Xylariaceae sp. FL0662B]
MMSPLTQTLLALFLGAGASLAYSGDMTFYTPGLGACGGTNNENDRIVALSPAQYGNDANPNKAKVCGKHIKIHYSGKTTTAKVVDKCPGCASGSIDVSPSVFKQLASLDKGRVKVTWEYTSSSASVDDEVDEEVNDEVDEEEEVEL